MPICRSFHMFRFAFWKRVGNAPEQEDLCCSTSCYASLMIIATRVTDWLMCGCVHDHQHYFPTPTEFVSELHPVILLNSTASSSCETWNIRLSC